MAFQFKKLDIPEIIHIEPDVFKDDRGYFLEVYKMPAFKDNGISKPFVQINHSKSAKGVLRGLHYQKDPMAQGKLVFAVEGEVFDAAVDIRSGSPTYGQWVGVTLSAEKKNMLYIPEGFAHGFCVLSELAHVIYCCTEVYSPEHERGLIYNDKAIGIQWPTQDPVLADKDAANETLDNADNNFRYVSS